MPNRRFLPKGLRTATMLTPHRKIQVASALAESQATPFITLARQVGTECHALPSRLAHELSASDLRGAEWSHWDQELVEKVAAARHIPADYITSLECSGHSWLDDFLTGIAGETDEMVVLNAVKKIVRDLARAGHVILIGHGSIYLTRDLPGGLHIRLIAPAEVRIRNTAARLNISPAEAARQMRRLDRQREQFFKRFWPAEPLAPEMFAATLNVAELDEDRLTRSIVAMLPTEARSSSVPN